MRIARSIPEVQLDRRKSIGFVPTLGSLHEGHLSLIRAAKRECDQVVASIFVNPTQFDREEDYENYPREEEADLSLLKLNKVNLVFLPTVDVMYPNASVVVSVGGVAKKWEGAYRPGHFDGVATVVCKLFNIVRPDRAYFGDKDLQQCSVVQAMVDGLNMPVKLSIQPTVREKDGLAMSSRNKRLREGERQVAPALYQELLGCSEFLRSTKTASNSDIENALMTAKKNLESKGFRVEYFELVDRRHFEVVRQVVPFSSLITAAYLGKVRLIDNVQVL